MATILNDAIVKITLDPGAARAELESINKDIAHLEDASRKAGDEEKKAEEAQKKAQEKAGEAAGKGTAAGGGAKKGFQLPPLTAAGFAGAIPGIGGAARFATEQVERFGPLAEGITQSLTSELPPGIREIVEKTVSEAQFQVRKLIDTVDAKLKAVSATMEQIKQVGKAQLLLGGQINAGDLSSFAKNEYAIQSAMLRLQREREAQVMKELGMNGGASVLNTLRKMIKAN